MAYVSEAEVAFEPDITLPDFSYFRSTSTQEDLDIQLQVPREALDTSRHARLQHGTLRPSGPGGTEEW